LPGSAHPLFAVVLLLLGPLALLVVCIADEVTNSRFYCWFIVAAYYSVVVFCNYGFPFGFLIVLKVIFLVFVVTLCACRFYLHSVIAWHLLIVRWPSPFH